MQSLVRGLAVIRAFDRDHPRMTLSQVAQQTGLTRATARRFLLTLVEVGYTATDGKHFWLSPAVLQLGHAYLSALTLPEVAGPHLETLAVELSESVSASVLDGDDIVYVARVPTRRIMAVTISVGTRFPAYATSMGRVLLADLPEDALTAHLARAPLRSLTPHTRTDPQELRAEVARVRAQGWAQVDQELELGLRSLAVPVHDASGRVVAALNVSSSASASTPEESRAAVLPGLLATARTVSRELGLVAGASGR